MQYSSFEQKTTISTSPYQKGTGQVIASKSDKFYITGPGVWVDVNCGRYTIKIMATDVGWSSAIYVQDEKGVEKYLAGGDGGIKEHKVYDLGKYFPGEKVEISLSYFDKVNIPNNPNTYNYNFRPSINVTSTIEGAADHYSSLTGQSLGVAVLYKPNANPKFFAFLGPSMQNWEANVSGQSGKESYLTAWGGAGFNSDVLKASISSTLDGTWSAVTFEGKLKVVSKKLPILFDLQLNRIKKDTKYSKSSDEEFVLGLVNDVKRIKVSQDIVNDIQKGKRISVELIFTQYDNTLTISRSALDEGTWKGTNLGEKLLSGTERGFVLSTYFPAGSIKFGPYFDDIGNVVGGYGGVEIKTSKNVSLKLGADINEALNRRSYDAGILIKF